MNYPDNVNPGDPDAPWNQEHVERPAWYCFNKVMHVGIRANSLEEAQEQIAFLNGKFKWLEIELDSSQWEEG